jgi:hypothetical protein
MCDLMTKPKAKANKKSKQMLLDAKGLVEIGKLNDAIAADHQAVPKSGRVHGRRCDEAIQPGAEVANAMLENQAEKRKFLKRVSKEDQSCK